MPKKLHIAISPLTDTIYCGHILKEGIWAANKQDLTNEALLAVAELVNRHGAISISADGIDLFEVTVKDLRVTEINLRT